MELKLGRKPCIHCGQCCRDEICPVGEIFMRTTTPPCSALTEDGNGKFWCGLITNPDTTMFAETSYAKYYTKVIAELLEENIFKFGAGCELSEK